MHYLNDYQPGDTVALGTASVPQDEIDAFNQRYDPQPQYLDDSLAGPLHGGRIASPWQAAALAQSIFVREFLNQTADFGVSEIRAVRYDAPLRADTTVRGELEINAVNDEPDRPDRGVIDANILLFDADDQRILSQNVIFSVSKKPRRCA
ncbi:MAG: hypothetical protein AAGC71_18210 [Pseudomonadota bacterium]